MNEKLTGIIIPVATPFDEEGSLSVPMFRDNLAKWAQTGVRGLMCLASNGEFRSMSDDESIVVAREAIPLKGDKTLIVGVGRESLRLTLAFLDRVVDLGPGIDYVSVLTPHYFSKLMDDQALLRYYEAIADYSKIPVLVYVAPGFANSVTVSPSVVGTLAAHPNIHGMKDSSTAMMVDYILSAGGRADFDILAGSLSTLMICLTLGGSGGVVSAANYFPSQCAHITDLYFSGQHKEAVASFLELERVVKEAAVKYSVAGLKCCMNLCGFSGGRPRLPVKPLSAEQENEVKAVLLRNHMIEA